MYWMRIGEIVIIGAIASALVGRPLGVYNRISTPPKLNPPPAGQPGRIQFRKVYLMHGCISKIASPGVSPGWGGIRQLFRGKSHGGDRNRVPP